MNRFPLWILGIAVTFSAHAQSDMGPLTKEERALQRSTCQMEVLLVKGEDLSSGVLKAGEHDITVSSMCSGVVTGRATYRTSQHCVNHLGYNARTKNSKIARVLCEGGKEVHFFSRKSVDYNRKFVENNTLESTADDYVTVAMSENFQVPTVTSAMNLGDLVKAVQNDQCVAFGYSSTRAADGARARKIQIHTMDVDLRRMLAQQNPVYANENLLFIGYQNVIFHGDSGGPLFCRNTSGKYILVGTLTAISPLQVKRNVDPDAIRRIFPDGTELVGDTIYLFTATSLRGTILK